MRGPTENWSGRVPPSPGTHSREGRLREVCEDGRKGRFSWTHRRVTSHVLPPNLRTPDTHQQALTPQGFGGGWLTSGWGHGHIPPGCKDHPALRKIPHEVAVTGTCSRSQRDRWRLPGPSALSALGGEPWPRCLLVGVSPLLLDAGTARAQRAWAVGDQLGLPREAGARPRPDSG